MIEWVQAMKPREDLRRLRKRLAGDVMQGVSDLSMRYFVDSIGTQVERNEIGGRVEERLLR